MKIGYISQGDPGIFRSLMLPEVADAMVAGETFAALAVTIDDIAVGTVVGQISSSCLEVLSLYVAPEYRRRTVGTLLMETLMDISKELAYSVEISFTVTEDEHNSLHPFLKYLGFKKEEDYGEGIYMSTVGDVVLGIDTSYSARKTCVSFAELDDYILSAATKTVIHSYEQIPEGGLESDTIDRDVSVAILKNGVIASYIAIDTSWTDGLIFSAIRVDHTNTKELMSLLQTVAIRMHEKYPPETKLLFQVVRSEGFALLRSLLSGRIEQVSFTYYCSLK